MYVMPRPTGPPRFAMRVDGKRKARWSEAATKAGLSLSAWVGLACDHAAEGRVTVETPRRRKPPEPA
jgi:predicted HicB family RNase H-like nuclease